MTDLSGIIAIARRHQKMIRRINRQLEPLRQVQESVHRQLEPTAQLANQLNENITRVMKPVCEKVKDIADLFQNFQSTDYPEIQTLDIELELHPTANHTLFTDDDELDIASTRHQLESDNAHLKAENEVLKSQKPPLPNLHTEHRKKGGHKRHEMTNLIKNEIIQPFFCSSLIKGKTTRQIAYKIHDLFQKQDINNSENISNPQLEKLSRLLNLDKKLISQTIEYCSKNQDTRNTLYRWCLAFNKNKTSQ